MDSSATLASPEAESRDLLRRASLFVLLACGFSWALWLPAIASQRGWIAMHWASGPWGSFGPALSGWFMAWRYGEPVGVRDWLRSLIAYRGTRRWLLVAMGIPTAATLAGVVAFRVVDGPLPALQAGTLLWAPAIVLLILLVGGPLGEEPGWRGYLVPTLLRRYPLLPTSLAVAAVWVLWHLPLFWMEGAAQEGTSLGVFTVFVVSYSLLFTWLYLETAPSLVPVLVLHTAVNVLSFGLPFVLPRVDEPVSFNAASTAVVAGAALWVAARHGGRRLE